MKTIDWKYTLGEILIVIVGITIAFSMNKCAANAKNDIQKNQYLTSLKNDVEADKLQLEENLKALEFKFNTATEILPVLVTDAKDNIQVMRKIFSIADITNFYSKDITYQTLINSGDLKLIDDFEIKTAIEAHYSNYKIMLKNYERQENIHKTYLGDYFINYADYDEIGKGNFPFKNEKLLKNIIQSMRGSFGLKMEATKKGIVSCDSLITTISKAL